MSSFLDQLSIICVNNDHENIAEEHQAISDDNNNEISIIENTKPKPIKRLGRKRKFRWIFSMINFKINIKI